MQGFSHNRWESSKITKETVTNSLTPRDIVEAAEGSRNRGGSAERMWKRGTVGGRDHR